MREPLPNRRTAETLEFERDGIRCTMTVGRDSDGKVKELFLNSSRQNSMGDVILSDCAIIASIALQHGVTVEHLAHSIKRDKYGLAVSPIAAALDRIVSPISENSEVVR